MKSIDLNLNKNIDNILEINNLQIKKLVYYTEILEKALNEKINKIGFKLFFKNKYNNIDDIIKLINEFIKLNNNFNSKKIPKKLNQTEYLINKQKISDNKINKLNNIIKEKNLNIINLKKKIFKIKSEYDEIINKTNLTMINTINKLKYINNDKKIEKNNIIIENYKIIFNEEINKINLKRKKINKNNSISYIKVNTNDENLENENLVVNYIYNFILKIINNDKFNKKINKLKKLLKLKFYNDKNNYFNKEIIKDIKSIETKLFKLIF